MKILTWNMQGQGGIGDKATILHNILNTGEYDVLCIQEATEPLGSYCVREAHDGIVWCTMRQPIYPRTNQDYLYTVLYYEWGTGNSRCSLATYVKTALIISAGIYISPITRNIRGMLYVTLTNNYLIGNIHLISGNENLAYQQFLQLWNYAAYVAPILNKCLIGDFNINAMANRNTINQNMRFYDVGIKTQQSGGCLDYMYSPQTIPQQWMRLDEPGRYSDHSPVIYEL